jgi:branched-chain amino acid transport system permease protein
MRLSPRRSSLILLACTLFASWALGESALSLYVLFALTAIVTIGVSLSLGQAGVVSLGQGAFYACGAYTAGALATHGFPTLVGLLVAPLTTAFLALLVGLPVLVLRGHHLAFATLALHLILLSVVGEASYLGGDVGLQGIPYLELGPLALETPRAYAYLSSVALFAVVVVASNVLDSRPGRGLRAIAGSEIAAAALGVPVGSYRLMVFVLSASFAGLAGGIYAFFVRYLAPGSFPVVLSIEYVVMGTIGGLGTLFGGVVGSAFVVLLVDLLSRLATAAHMPSTAPVILSYAVYSLLLVGAVLFLPGGLVSLPHRLRAKLAAKWARPTARPTP